MDWLSDAVFVDQIADRQDRAQQPGQLCRRVRRDPQAVRRAPLAQERHYGAGMFSFNAGDGRCPTCGGSGFEHVEMQFLTDVYLRCPDCDGKRFRAELLEVKLSAAAPTSCRVADVLELTVAEACIVFSGDTAVTARLQPIVDVGLDYVRLGQPVPTLSRRRGAAAEAGRLPGRGGQGPSASRWPGAARCSCSTSPPPACTSTTSPS